MGKNRAYTWNPEHNPAKWSLCHLDSIARNCIQNKPHKAKKRLKMRLNSSPKNISYKTFSVEHTTTLLLENSPKFYSISLRIDQNVAMQSFHTFSRIQSAKIVNLPRNMHQNSNPTPPQCSLQKFESCKFFNCSKWSYKAIFMAAPSFLFKTFASRPCHRLAALPTIWPLQTRGWCHGPSVLA